MKQEAYKNSISSMSEGLETTDFVLEGNASVMQMLTQNVYNDPILAVMREWSTNACDACIETDLPVKFDVHIPTPSNPVFYVRDYGTGLSKKDVMGLFSVLGASTKRNSNKTNGVFGIGRMAGLAVADAFTVESFFDGMHDMYTISLKEGIPVTIHLAGQPTQEANGLKLSVNVENKDIGEFRGKVESLYKYFDYKPNLNIDDIDIELDTSEHLAEDWYIQRNTGSYYYNRSNYVLMSQVLYKIPDISAVKTQGFSGLIIKAPPSAVKINPGRESLSMDSRTVEYINTRFKEIAKEYIEITQTNMAIADTDKEVVNIYTTTMKSAPDSARSIVDPSLFLSDNLSTMRTDTHTYNNAPVLGNASMTALFEKETDNLLTVAVKHSYYKTARELKDNNTIDISNFCNAPHVIVDLKTRFRAAINEYFENKTVVIWQKKDKYTDLEAATKTAKDFLDGMGIEYLMASDIVEVPEEPLVKKARVGFYASSLTTSDEFKGSEEITAEQQTAGKYLYVKLKNTTPIIEESSGMLFHDYLTAYRVLQGIKSVPSIRGVAKKYQEYAESLPNWVSFEDYILEEFEGLELKTGPSTSPYKVMYEYRTSNIAALFPADLQAYIEEELCYSKFIHDKTFISSTNRHILEKFGAKIIEYAPSRTIDVTALSKRYKFTMPFLTGIGSVYRNPFNSSTELARLAKMEELYDLHSTK